MLQKPVSADFCSLHHHMSYGQNLVHEEGTSLRGGPLSVLQWGHLGQTFLSVSFLGSVLGWAPCSDGNPTTLSILLWIYHVAPNVVGYSYQISMEASKRRSIHWYLVVSYMYKNLGKCRAAISCQSAFLQTASSASKIPCRSDWWRSLTENGRGKAIPSLISHS